MASSPTLPRKTHAGIPPWAAVPNFFFEKFMKVLPAPHFKVLLHLWYAIYGRWHRGVGLVTWAEIRRATGVSRYVVAESLSWFAQVGLVGRRSNHLRDVNQFTL